MLTGVDVSHHQGHIDWVRVAQAGHAFAIVKATEGVTFRDSRFRANWRAIPNATLARGAYHFLRREQDARRQARHFYATLVADGGDRQLRGSLLAVDVETNPQGSNPTVVQVAEFVDELRRLTGGHPVIIYTSWGWWRSHGHGHDGSRLGPLWHARYRPLEEGPGPLYGGWDRFTFWQHTSTGRCPGIAGNVDLNVFYGERTDLAPLAYIPPPRPPEDEMQPHAVKLDDGNYAYVIPDGTVVDQVPNDQQQWVPLRAGSAGLDAFRSVYEGDQANRRQIDIVQAAVRAAREA